jgi:hypothetical protein
MLDPEAMFPVRTPEGRPSSTPRVIGQGGGWGPPPGPPGGWNPQSPYGYPPAPPPGGSPPGPDRPKPITGGKETLALHAMSIDPVTGLPRGEAPPASTASVVALVAGILLCLGPIAGAVALVAGILGRRAASADPAGVGGIKLANAGIVLGITNFVLWFGVAFLLLVGALWE